MQDQKAEVARRTLLGGVATVGTLAVAAGLLAGREKAPAAVATAKSKSADDAAGGYQLTEHVKQYYKTARI